MSPNFTLTLDKFVSPAFVATKGHLISKCLFGVLKKKKKQTETIGHVVQ